MLAPGTGVPFEVRLRTEAGRWTVFEMLASNMCDVEDVGGVVFHGRDVTERYESQRRFRMLFEQSPVPQALVRPGTDRLIANRSVRAAVRRGRRAYGESRHGQLRPPGRRGRVREGPRRAPRRCRGDARRRTPLPPRRRRGLQRPGQRERGTRRERRARVPPRHRRGHHRAGARGRGAGQERGAALRSLVENVRHRRRAVPERPLERERRRHAPPRLPQGLRRRADHLRIDPPGRRRQERASAGRRAGRDASTRASRSNCGSSRRTVATTTSSAWRRTSRTTPPSARWS